MSTDPRDATVIVLAKRPRPGFVKTRLVPPFTYAGAAELAAAALRDTLRTVDSAGFGRRVLSLDDEAGDWLPDGWLAHRQPEQGGLAERIVAAMEFAPDGPVVLVGMDTPQLRIETLRAFDPIGYDACLGLASDGGYWLIGFANPWDAAGAVLGVEMSLPSTGADQLARLHAQGLRVQLLEELTDVDTVDVARRVAFEAPHTEFAHTLRALLPSAVA